MTYTFDPPLKTIAKEAAACRAAWAAQPSDFGWHIHHQVIAEPLVEPIGNRIDYVVNSKVEHERAARLRLLRPITDVPAALDKAAAASDKAWAASDKAWAASHKASAAYVKARAASDKAWAALDKARAAYDFTALHAAQCGCPFGADISGAWS